MQNYSPYENWNDNKVPLYNPEIWRWNLSSFQRQTYIIFQKVLLHVVKASYSERCVKSVQIRNFFWSVFSCIQSETGKYGPEIIPYLDTFHAVVVCSCYNFIQKDDSCRDALSPMIDALALLSTASVGINAISKDLIK